jgi:hypothetical protein
MTTDDTVRNEEPEVTWWSVMRPWTRALLIIDLTLWAVGAILHVGGW